MSAEILRKRTALLASRHDAAAPAEPPVPVLALALGKERYAIGLAELREVVAPARWTSVPGGPPELLGVMNARGEVRAVWDLGRLLGLPAAEGGPAGCVLVVKNDGREAGLRADHVEGRRELPAAGLSRPPESEDGPSPFIKGAMEDGILLLDAAAILGRIFSEDGPALLGG